MLTGMAKTESRGRVSFHTDRQVEEIFQAKPEQVMHFPNNIRQAFENPTNSPGKALLFQLPAGKTEDFFKFMAELPKEPPLSTQELSEISSQCGTDQLEMISSEIFYGLKGLNEG